MMKPFEYFRPTSLKEALALLNTYGEEATLLNGGTDLIVRMREGHSSPKAVIDIKHIEMLRKIKVTDSEITIGACVLLNDVGSHPVIRERVPFLAQAALSVGSKQVRNRATCIGNICNASPLADTATPLLALDAEVEIYGEAGVKRIPLKDFFVFVRKTVLKQNEIVTSISFNTNKDAKGIFEKMSRRKEVDLSTVCGTVFRGKDGYRVSMGAVAPTPIRLYKTEAYLDAHDLTEDVIQSACEVAVNEVSPISDIRASKAYRQELVHLILKHALSEWL
ncbi:xanthine dehydrogenase family protein subunit M [Fusibacter sp. 3D3]|uniref:FAD binding domain-containing protein n=1 Tax=Fusibacter sp. 3D3 TaxID=1048380 RepID=UPI00085395A8|nr:xanthine dehydrogenase family protein subunit M [Fusibacter sp. 3D3]GAU77087.1 xanthine dehydrogenase [Fusibacter sp. 3D3]